jgi:hypothetical protein
MQRSRLLLSILKLIHENNYPAAIAKRLEESPQKIHYWIKKLVKWGYIQQIPREYEQPIHYHDPKTGKVTHRKIKKKGNITFYKLTDQTYQKINVRDDKTDSGFDLHHLALRFEVVRDNLGWLWEPKVRLRHGVVMVDGVVRYGGQDFSVRRWFSPSGKCWIVVYGPRRYCAKNLLDMIAKGVVELYCVG